MLLKQNLSNGNSKVPKKAIPQAHKPALTDSSKGLRYSSQQTNNLQSFKWDFSLVSEANASASRRYSFCAIRLQWHPKIPE
ncbi:hypothetical protein DPV78_008827 [Talaromyces pinophilus]|nr:hypothetical protein DPV78_008827 [Talaromyces pinophilus]